MIIFNKIPCENKQIKTKKITCTVWDNSSGEARINTRTIKGRINGNGAQTVKLERFVLVKHKNNCLNLFNLLQNNNKQFSVEIDKMDDLGNVFYKN